MLFIEVKKLLTRLINNKSSAVVISYPIVSNIHILASNAKWSLFTSCA